MISVTQPKVAGFAATWAKFPGFSLLFDNPGDSFKQLYGFQKVSCDPPREPALAFYAGLCDALDSMGRTNLLWDYGMCFLPTESFHVTVFDGGNAANLAGAHEDSRDDLESLLKSISENWDSQHRLVRPLATWAESALQGRSVRFCYGSLAIWDCHVMAVYLMPADEESKNALAELEKARAALSQSYRNRFGFGAGPSFRPHVSLAYFANLDGGKAAEAQRDHWDQVLRERVAGRTISFDSVSAYAFTDMATFFRSSLSAADQ